MNKKLLNVSKILSAFENFWFSDTIGRFFIAFPAGMWITMMLVGCVTMLERSSMCWYISIILFTMGAVATVLVGGMRSMRSMRSMRNDKRIRMGKTKI